MNANASPSPDRSYPWVFFRSGGVDQVVLRSGEDLVHIRELDQALWMALSMPTRGVELDPRTADVLDTDHDGRIRPLEVMAAVEWAEKNFSRMDDLIKGGDSVPLASIKEPALRAGAKRILQNLGKPEAAVITLADVSDKTKIFGQTRFNGDGVIPADAAEDEATQKAIADIISVMGATEDRSGKPGVNQAASDAFFDQANAYLAWHEQAKTDTSILPLEKEKMSAALEATQAVAAKVEDFFARCRLAAYDQRAMGALNREESHYLSMAAKDLTIQDAEIAALPLSAIEPDKALPLKSGLNPAWDAAMAALHDKAVLPLLGAKQQLTSADWSALRTKLAAFSAWLAAMPPAGVAALGVDRLRELTGGHARETISGLIAQDAALAEENAQVAAVEKLVRFQRDLFKLLTNYVNFADFYGQKGALFQVGTLYLDARACSLCVDVTDEAKHATMAGLSGAYLAYCEIKRPGGLKRAIVAAFTDGDSDNLMVGRNGVFYDRQGLDWDATITKVVANPISIREAFWLPYKKLIRFIEDQVAKRAQAADETSTAKLSDTAAVVAAADQKPAASPAKKLDLGTIALIGAAVGGISALVAGLLQAMFGLGIWLPLGIVGIVLLISGPSMLLAWLKLRNRNLGPLLDANGWAINTKAKLNVPFGAALTNVAKLPAGSKLTLNDPFTEKKRPWKTYAVVVIVLLLALAWLSGRMDPYLYPSLQCANVLTGSKVVPPELAPPTETEVAPAAEEAPAEVAP